MDVRLDIHHIYACYVSGRDTQIIEFRFLSIMAEYPIFGRVHHHGGAGMNWCPGHPYLAQYVFFRYLVDQKYNSTNSGAFTTGAIIGKVVFH